MLRVLACSLSVPVCGGCVQTVAGGCVLALACDFRVASRGKYNIGVDEVRQRGRGAGAPRTALRLPSCWFGPAQVRNNVPFPKVTMEIIRIALSNKAQREALLLGMFWKPEGALQAGVVDAVASTPADAVTQACATVCGLPRDALAPYAANKAYLQAPYLAAMRGETCVGAGGRTVPAGAAPCVGPRVRR